MVNEFRGTPGPWETDLAEHDCPHQNITIRSQDQGAIAKVWIDDAPVEDYNRRQYANAALMVAAPDMAALLNDIGNWLVCAPITVPEDMAQSFGPFQQEIDRVLNKALGR